MTASFKATVSVCVLVGLLAGTAIAVPIVIDTVAVGDVGNTADILDHSGNPAGQGSVAYTYNIGKYEVTAGQYTEFLNAKATTDTYTLYNASMANTADGCKIQQSGTSGHYTYSVDANFVNRPVNYVSYWDACRFTNWLHNGQGSGDTETGTYTLNGYNGSDGYTILRNAGATWAVTSEDEWYKAAYYKGGSTNAGYWNFPTRSNTAPGQDMNDGSGNNANYKAAPYVYPIDSGKYTTVGGEFQNSASPYGTFDQGGNVYEWNDAVLLGKYRGMRGGSFYSSIPVSLHASGRSSNYPSVESDTVGFRVSEVPEPATIMMLGLAGVMVTTRKR